MLELLKSLVFAVIMVPVVMAIILGAIYGPGEVFNVFSNIGHRDQPKSSNNSPQNARPARAFCSQVFPLSADSYFCSSRVYSLIGTI